MTRSRFASIVAIACVAVATDRETKAAASGSSRAPGRIETTVMILRSLQLFVAPAVLARGP